MLFFSSSLHDDDEMMQQSASKRVRMFLASSLLNTGCCQLFVMYVKPRGGVGRWTSHPANTSSSTSYFFSPVVNTTKMCWWMIHVAIAKPETSHLLGTPGSSFALLVVRCFMHAFHVQDLYSNMRLPATARWPNIITVQYLFFTNLYHSFIWTHCYSFLKTGRVPPHTEHSRPSRFQFLIWFVFLVFIRPCLYRTWIRIKSKSEEFEEKLNPRTLIPVPLNPFPSGFAVTFHFSTHLCCIENKWPSGPISHSEQALQQQIFRCYVSK